MTNTVLEALQSLLRSAAPAPRDRWMMMVSLFAPAREQTEEEALEDVQT